YVLILYLPIYAIIADQIAPYGMREQNLSNSLQCPNTTHWLGTDDLGRDILSRMIYGTRVSLTVGVSAVAVSLIIGGILGVVAGYYKGWIDTLIMRFCDILLSIPSILLAIAIDRKSTLLISSHFSISYAVFCLNKINSE